MTSQNFYIITFPSNVGRIPWKHRIRYKTCSQMNYDSRSCCYIVWSGTEKNVWFIGAKYNDFIVFPAAKFLDSRTHKTMSFAETLEVINETLPYLVQTQGRRLKRLPRSHEDYPVRRESSCNLEPLQLKHLSRM